MQEEKTILLVDGSNLVFRMYFALERTGMTSPSGKPSWAIFGFFKALLDSIEKEGPTTVVSAFDTKHPTFRHEAVDYYKANRPDEMPEPLALQWPEIKKGISLIGMSMVELPGWEADDLIGTLATQATSAGWKVLILSGDRDNFQLVDDNVKILMPGNGGIQEIGRDEVKTKMGIYPEQVVDFKSLCGDSSDNIPGVAGIGEKTAIKLLTEYGSLENIYKNIDSIESKSLQRKLIDGKDSAEESKFLATIKTDCPISYPFEQLAHPLTPKMPELKEFLNEYKLASLEKRLPKIFKSFGSTVEEQETFSLNLFESQEQNTTNNLVIENTIEDFGIHRETILSESQLNDAFSKIRQASQMSLDLETDGLDTKECNIVGCSLAWEENKQIQSIYIPIGHSYLGAPSQISVDNLVVKLKYFFTNWTGILFTHNSKFEYKILKRYGITLPSSNLDTMLASYVEDPDQPHNLKGQIAQVFDYQMTQIESLIGAKGKNQKTMDQIEIDKVSPYACDDAAFTLKLGIHYLQILPEKLKKLWIEIESPLALLLAEMELNGVYINANKLKDISDEIGKQIINLEADIINELGAGPINLNSAQQLGKALTAKGFKISKATGTGQISTDSKTLNELKEQDETGLIEKIMEHRVLSKLRSTYTDSLAKQIYSQTGRVHGELNQALTATGRLSSSNPNLQNIPVKNQEFGKLIRGAFEAQNNNILISADYSQIELRVLAHYTQDPTLVDAFQQGQDIHLRTAAEIFDLAPEKVTNDLRRIGKTLNFALIYQQGPYATAQQLGISNKEASEFIKKYFATFTKVRPFMEETINQAAVQGYVETLWGRRRYFKNLTSSSAMLRKAEERAAFNAPLQGTAADIMKIAMIRVQEKLITKKLSAKLILQVHDEIVLEVNKEQLLEVTEVLKQEMVIGQPLLVPILVQVGSGPNWAECK